MLREPVVAGRFYPGQPQELQRMVDGFLVASAVPRPAIGVMLPHAGYIYSGAVAGVTLARVTVPEIVVLLGPNHHGHGAAAALWPGGSWRTPLGEVPVAAEFATELLAAEALLTADPVAHRHEHSLEVELPLLQRLQPRLRIVPLCLGHLSLPDLLTIGRGLGRLCARQTVAPLLLASSDMTHYEPAGVARQKDERALAQVLALDPEGLFRTVRDERISMCGVLPTVVMLAAARELGATTAELVRYAHSGEVSGDRSEVVGYAGVVVC